MLLINPKFKTQSRLKYIETVEEIVDSIKIYLNSNKDDDRNRALELIKNYLLEIKKTGDNVKTNPFGNLMKKFASLLMQKDINKEEFLKLINTVKENLKVMKDAVQGIQDYLRSQGTIKETSIYEVDPEHLGGYKIVNNIKKK
jgi:predicted ATPase